MAELAPDWETAVEHGSYAGVELAEIAKMHGTPAYVYAVPMIREACWKVLHDTDVLNPRLRYAVKANNNIVVMKLVRTSGYGLDVASEVELLRAVAAGGYSFETIMTGPGKSANALETFMRWGGEEIVSDSSDEMNRILNAWNKKDPIKIGIRVNPDIKAGGHPNISTGTKSSKFGVEPEQAIEFLAVNNGIRDLQVGCLNVHIGSQVDELQPYKDAFLCLLSIRDELERLGIEPPMLDLGGGFAIGDSHARPDPTLLAQLANWIATKHPGVPVGFQPGRILVGRSAIILTRVIEVKNHNVIVDAAMTELLRPALYEARHGVAKVGHRLAGVGEHDMVGPVCESSDWLARKCDMEGIRQGDLVAIFDAGAYGSSMMSCYNGRLRPCEIAVTERGEVRLIRRRETVDDNLSFEPKDVLVY